MRQLGLTPDPGEDRIRAALASGQRKTGERLRKETGLGDDFYASAGPMYERRELRTSGEGMYWIEERRGE